MLTHRPLGRTDPRPHRLVVALIASLVALVLVMLTAETANAQTNDGLEVSSSTIYAPDPQLEQVAVSATYVITNRQPDEIIGDSVRSFFYTQWVIAMPATATDFVASAAGQPLQASIEIDPDTEDVVFGTIILPFNLNYEQTVQLDVSFTIPGGEPRTGGTIARINDSFLSFSVWAAGDPGRTDVRIEIPAGFIIDTQGDLDEFRETRTPDSTILEAIAIQDPQDFFGQIYGRNDRGLLTETAELPGATATIRAWPDDPEWAMFVAGAIEDDVPVIEDLTGLDWPAGDIEVIETVTPYLFGYGGWFNASSGQIEIGDSLERDLILHELGHAWFNNELIDGRWITEGLAEEFASRTIEATSGEVLEPTQPELDDPLRVPLAAWASPWTLDEEDAFAYEQFHYNASWWVIRQITNDIGLEAFSDVLIALRDDELPYQGEGPGEQTSQPTRWTHMYDLLDERGASNLDELFRTYVLTPQEQGRLQARSIARSEYEALDEAGQTWSPPLVVRQAMTAWQFDEARAMMQISDEILKVRDERNLLAAELDVRIDNPIEDAYEIALSSDDLTEALNDIADTLTRLQTLERDRIDLAQQAAALNTTVAFAPMSYDEARHDIDTQRNAIDQVGQLRADVQDAARSLDLVAPDWPQSAGPTDFVAARALAEARLATLMAIADTTAVVDAPQNLMQNIGLVRSDPNELLQQARDAFQADELDTALTATATADAMISNAESTGKTRVLWAAVLFAAVVIATLLIAWFQRRRHTTRTVIDVRHDAVSASADVHHPSKQSPIP